MARLDFNEDMLAEDLGPRLYRYFYLSFSADLASDLVQETLLRLWRNLREGRVKKEVRDVERYAFGIARILKKEEKRKYAKNKHLDEQGSSVLSKRDGDDIIDNVDNRFRLYQLREAMGQLKENEKDILSMAVSGRLKLEEIASILEIPIGTVKSHVFRAKENLKQLLLTQDRRSI